LNRKLALIAGLCLVAASCVAPIAPMNQTLAATGIPRILGSTDSSANAPESSDDNTFIAFRFDKTRVFFAIAHGGDATFDFDWDETQNLQDLGKPAAGNAVEELWIANAKTVHDNSELFNRANVGEEWRLEVSATSKVRVIVTKPVVASVMGNAIAGFLAEVEPQYQSEFSASPSEYFLIHKGNDVSKQNSNNTALRLGRLPTWRATPKLQNGIQQLLNEELKKRLGSMHHFAYQDEDASRRYPELATNFERWRKIDQKLRNGESKLDYDMQAFRMTPDGRLRLFIRARWMVDQQPGFLMSVWVRLDPQLLVESVNATQSEVIRTLTGYAPGLDSLGTIVNVFDQYADNRATFLIFTPEYEGFEIQLFRYSDAGPVATKADFGGSA
jgi:hypothetical protein